MTKHIKYKIVPGALLCAELCAGFFCVAMTHEICIDILSADITDIE